MNRTWRLSVTPRDGSQQGSLQEDLERGRPLSGTKQEAPTRRCQTRLTTNPAASVHRGVALRLCVLPLHQRSEIEIPEARGEARAWVSGYRRGELRPH